MRNIRQAKRPHAAISNLEDGPDRPAEKSKIMGSSKTAGLMKPPQDYTPSNPSPPSSPRSSDFSDLEDLLVRDLSNESCQ